MPLWRIYAHPDIFTPAQRAALAKDITDLYVNKINLPAFYVNVFFIPLEQDNYYVGGEPRKNFVRITAEHIARTMPGPDTQTGRDHRNGWMDMVNQVLKPHIANRPELEWEHNFVETPFDLWRVGGLLPPPPESEAEQEWKRSNKAHPYHLECTT